MQAWTTTTQQVKELAHRAGDGIDVSLLWSPVDNRLAVVVDDVRTGDSFELAAHPENALDAFYHPFAYAAFTGIAYRDTSEALAA